MFVSVTAHSEQPHLSSIIDFLLGSAPKLPGWHLKTMAAGVPFGGVKTAISKLKQPPSRLPSPAPPLSHRIGSSPEHILAACRLSASLFIAVGQSPLTPSFLPPLHRHHPPPGRIHLNLPVVKLRVSSSHVTDANSPCCPAHADHRPPSLRRPHLCVRHVCARVR